MGEDSCEDLWHGQLAHRRENRSHGLQRCPLSHHGSLGRKGSVPQTAAEQAEEHNPLGMRRAGSIGWTPPWTQQLLPREQLVKSIPCAIASGFQRLCVWRELRLLQWLCPSLTQNAGTQRISAARCRLDGATQPRQPPLHGAATIKETGITKADADEEQPMDPPSMLRLLRHSDPSHKPVS